MAATGAPRPSPSRVAAALVFALGALPVGGADEWPSRLILEQLGSRRQLRAHGVPTASWEVTGVLGEGGGPDWRAQRATFLFRRAAGEENFGLESRFP